MRTRLLAVVLAAGLDMPMAFASDKPAEPAPATPPAATVPSTPAPAPETPAAAQAPTPQVAPQAAEPQGPEKPKVAAPAPPTLVVKINLSNQRMEVNANGVQIHSWPISSGRPGYETPRGTFRAQWAARMWYSRKYDMAPMPHAVFINGGVAIHATSAVGLLGRPASHGCIRLSPSNAATFFALAHKHGLRQTQVSVIGSSPAPRIAAARQRQPVTSTPRVRVAGRAEPVFLPGDRGGVLRLRPGSPYYGASSFEHNGVRYIRVR